MNLLKLIHNNINFLDLFVTDNTKRRNQGFSLVEIIIAIAIVGTLSAIVIPGYVGYMERARVYSAIETICAMSIELTDYGIENGSYPTTLADFGYGDVLDPWGNPYQYLNMSGANKGQMRKDKFLVPINSDFDLYSMGKDGQSAAALTAKISKDDIVRANDGQYIGLAEAY